MAEKILSLFVKRQIFHLKNDLSERLLSAFSEDTKRIDAVAFATSILTCTTRTILEASPRKLRRGQVSIFEEEPDLVALLTQKHLKMFFKDFKTIVLTLCDRVQDLTPNQQASALA